MHSRWVRLSLLALLALGSACAATGPRPGSAAAAAVPAAATEPVYLDPKQIDSVSLIEPPPADGSAAAAADLQAVLAAQRSAHADGTIARAVADTQVDCQRVADVLGAPGAHGSLASGEGAAAVGFATRAARQVAGATDAPKRYWGRSRPYAVSSEVERLGDVAPNSPLAIAGGFARAHTSYPSGHSAFGTACAIVLAQMVPEQRGALFARARLYGESRLVVGAHFPTDVDAGRRVGTAATGMMLQNAQFQADLRAARAQLRRALDLAAVAP